MIDATYAYSLDAKDELGYLRDRFVVNDSELIYLDGNSLGRLPRATENRLRDLIAQEWGQRLIRSWGEGWFELQQTVGNKIAQIIGARPGEVIVADSTSINLYKLALAAMMARPMRKHILSDDLNFPSDYYIFQGITQLLPGAKLRRLSSPDGIHGVPLADLSAAMNEDTNLLSLSHTAFKSGYTYDMAAVTAVAREKGVMTLWDLSHSVGSVPIDLHHAKADLAVGCTYKYLNGGPGAPAFLYVRQSLQETLGNPISGWFGQKNMFALDPNYTPEPNIRRFLTGTPPVLSLAAVEMGVDTVLEAGMGRLRAKSIAQTEFFIELFHQILEPLGFVLNSPADVAQRGSHVSIGHPEGWRINRALIEDKHVLPDFREPDNLRLGFAPLYTSFSDIYTAVMRLRAVLNEKLYEKYSPERTTVT
ncbi:MAG: kynureninase [Anaerolineales bacterium]|nr:kynureninase [Anaerolineales bacterium]